MNFLSTLDRAYLRIIEQEFTALPLDVSLKMFVTSMLNS